MHARLAIRTRPEGATERRQKRGMPFGLPVVPAQLGRNPAQPVCRATTALPPAQPPPVQQQQTRTVRDGHPSCVPLGDHRGPTAPYRECASTAALPLRRATEAGTSHDHIVDLVRRGPQSPLHNGPAAQRVHVIHRSRVHGPAHSDWRRLDDDSAERSNRTPAATPQPPRASG
jgi:hypothetical protein